MEGQRLNIGMMRVGCKENESVGFVFIVMRSLLEQDEAMFLFFAFWSGYSSIEKIDQNDKNIIISFSPNTNITFPLLFLCLSSLPL